MQNTNKTHLYALTALLIGFILFPGDKCAAKRQHAFDYRLERTGILDVTKPITFELEGTPVYPECGTNVTVNVIVSTFNREISRSTKEFDLESDSSFSMSFSVSIVNNDTTEVTVEMTCGRFTEKARNFFVTTADTVEYWKGNPRDYKWRPMPSAPLIKVDLKVAPPDSNYYRWSIIDSTANEKSQLDEMRQLEKEPLTGAQLQYQTVGKDLYRRLEGETRFTLVKRMSAEASKAKRQAYLDSLAGLPPNAQVQVCLNLRGHHLEFVEETVGPLDTPESESYYHLTVTRELLEQLREQGVPIMYLDLEDMVHRPHPSDRSEPSDPQGGHR